MSSPCLEQLWISSAIRLWLIGEADRNSKQILRLDEVARNKRLVVKHSQNRFHQLVWSERLGQACLEADIQYARSNCVRDEGGHSDNRYTASGISSKKLEFLAATQNRPFHAVYNVGHHQIRTAMFCCLEAFEPIPRYQGLAHETESIPLTEYCRARHYVPKFPKP
jgi:hypothetical protein